MWFRTPLALIWIVTLVGSISASTGSGDPSSFALDHLSLQDFLSVISGVVKIGNVTITFPDDLPKLFGGGLEVDSNSMSHRRGFEDYENDDKALKIKIKSDGWGSGWGWSSHGGHGGRGLYSLANFFRMGCILFDLREIKESTRHGWY